MYCAERRRLPCPPGWRSCGNCSIYINYLRPPKFLVIPYKGPVLAWVAYGSFVRREYSDLDFAVEQKYIPDVVAVLKSAGYRPQFDPREAHAGEDGIAPGQYSFLSHPQKILTEFHTERTLRYFPTPIDFQELTSRLMTVEIGEQRLRTFSIEDTLVMLCVHGAKHFWERLGWVLDIAKLMTAQEVDWALAHPDRGKNGIHPRAPAGTLSGARLVWCSLAGSIAAKRFAGTALFKSWRKKFMNNTRTFRIPAQGVLHRAAFRFRLRDGYQAKGCATLCASQ